MKSVKMILSRLYSQIHKREKYGETTLKIWKKYGKKGRIRKNTEKNTMKIQNKLVANTVKYVENTEKYVENTEKNKLKIRKRYGKIR